VSYEDGRGILRDILSVCTEFDFVINRMHIERQHTYVGQSELDIDDETSNYEPVEQAGIMSKHQPTKTVTIMLELAGRDSIPNLTSKLQEIPGVKNVATAPPSFSGD
jgi:hypothetical protein